MFLVNLTFVLLMLLHFLNTNNIPLTIITMIVTILNYILTIKKTVLILDTRYNNQKRH